MSYRITRRADADLKQIWSYIAQDSSDAADRVELDLHSAMHMLADMPGLGHQRSDVHPRYRFWRVYSYLIAYRVERGNVIVTRVVHGARDMRSLFAPRRKRS